MNLKKFSCFIQILIWFIILVVLLGGFYVEFFLGRKPCTLCLLTRVCMMGISISLLMNLWFGFTARQTALAHLFAILGCFTSLKQLSFHICGSLSPPPSSHIFGLQLWTWAFIVFMSTIFGLSLLNFVTDIADKIKVKRNGFYLTGTLLLLLILIVNMAVASKLCHFGSGCGYK